MECEVGMDQEGKVLIRSPEDALLQFNSRVLANLTDWKERLGNDPLAMADLQQEVQIEFRKGADMLMAGMMIVIARLASFDEAAEQTRSTYDIPLTKGRVRSLRIRLLGGLVVWFKSLYCEPRRGWFRESNSTDVPGLYIGLAQFGFANGTSPGLESHIARRVAMSHSFDFAVEELQREGVGTDYNITRRIAYECGNGLLTLRKRELLAWRNKRLLPGSELAGKRVGIQIDGGRLKTRGAMTLKGGGLVPPAETQVQTEPTKKAIEHNAKLVDNGGRSKANKGKKTFQSDWKEPKLVTIFIMDKQGKQLKGTKAWTEATLEGPDAIAEIIAMRLHQLGATQAESITFVSDGAPWIWDRLDRIVELAGIASSIPIYKVLDCCHAIGRMMAGLKHCGLGEKMTKGLYRVYRKLIREGRWEVVVLAFRKRLDRRKNLPEASRNEIRCVINYLQRHGEQGHLAYPQFGLLGLPLGSGAVESSIRRVINLRLKSNGSFWKASNAEALLQLRSFYVCRRLDDRLADKRVSLSQNGKLDWETTYPDLAKNADPSLANSA